ncbi:MAG: SDR family NAD(P)-dependent oxidoreductase [Gordonia sp. (in: high G+C Gram-positive bacteria)]
MDITGSHVLLTGASGGLGHALAGALAARGARLTLTGRRTDVVDALAQKLDATSISVDLSEPDGPARLLENAGQVDILIANAALPASGEVSEYSTEQIDRALAVNLRAPILLAKIAAEQMILRGHGHLVFMSSLSGKSASARTALYNATKFGIRGFALGLREDLRPKGIGVSSVFPGPVRDAGMVADSAVALPRLGTRSADQVAQATIRAIEKNRAEVTVAPLALQIATLLGGFAPDAAATLARLSGSDKVVAAISEGQRGKR